MDYTPGKCNIPIFLYEDAREQIVKNGGREWTSKEKIKKEHAKYNTRRGRADVIGYISANLALELTGIYCLLYVVTLGYRHIYIFPDGCTVT